MAEELGLPKDLIVVAGGFDQATAALGAGIKDKGIFSLGMGTVLCSHWMIDDFEKIKTNDYVYCNYLIKNKFFGLLVSLNGCGILNWFIDNFASKEKDKYKSEIFNYFNSRLDSNPSNLYFLPHFIGAPAPHNDPNSKGVIIGLKLDSNKDEILKSIYEGLSFDIRQNYENLMIKNDFKINEIRAVGGGSRSEIWVQILANVLNIKFYLLEIDEGGCLACAMLGAVAVGDFKNTSEAIDNFISIRKKIYPEKEKVGLFNEKFEYYKEIYPSIKKINHTLT